MVAHVHDDIIDNGLASLKSRASTIHICASEPTDLSTTNSTSLGNKALGAGAVIPGAISAGSQGRMVTTASVASGTVSGTGSAYNWAIVDSVALLAVGSLSAPQAVTSGNTFTLSAFTITIKSQ